MTTLIAGWKRQQSYFAYQHATPWHTESGFAHQVYANVRTCVVVAQRYILILASICACPITLSWPPLECMLAVSSCLRYRWPWLPFFHQVSMANFSKQHSSYYLCPRPHQTNGAICHQYSGGSSYSLQCLFQHVDTDKAWVTSMVCSSCMYFSNELLTWSTSSVSRIDT